MFSPTRRARSAPTRSGRGVAGAGLLVPLFVVLLGLAMAASAWAAAPAPTVAPLAPPAPPTIDVVQVRGVLDRSVTGYVAEMVERANREGTQALVVQLDTGGSVGPQATQLAAQIAASRVPVIVWVGPEGAQARGAGALLAMAAPGLVVAPGTTIGPGTPLDLRLPDSDAHAADLLATLARARGRDPARAAPLATEAATASADGISGLTPVAAAGLPDVLRELDGLEVVAGPDPVPQQLDIDPGQARVRFHSMGLIRRVLHTVASPTLCYLLLIAGSLALAFELFQPGFGVAGVGGLLVTALGAYGLTVLPVSWVALAALIAGLALLAADLAIGGLGLLTVAGTLSFGAGSWWLFPGPEPLGLAAWLVVATTAGCVLYFVIILTTVLRAQGQQARTGTAGLIGEVGVVRSVLNPEGLIFVHGGLWRARAPEVAGRVRTGTTVRVVGLNDRLTLDVEPVESGDSPPLGSGSAGSAQVTTES